MFDFRFMYKTSAEVFGYNYTGSRQYKKNQIRRKQLAKPNHNHPKRKRL